MATYKSFESLDCWKKCRIVRLWIHEILLNYRSSIDDDLAVNIRRASRSTTRNIAEGFGRFHFKENMRFCRISLGSLFEIKDDLITCRDENRIPGEELDKGLRLIDSSIRSTLGYINYLKSK